MGNRTVSRRRRSCRRDRGRIGLTPWRLKRKRSRHLDKGLPGAGGGPDVELALARAAYERDDYLRACELLSGNWKTRSLSAQLLFADACKELGTVKGDEASVAVFEKLADNLRNDPGPGSRTSRACRLRKCDPRQRPRRTP